MTQTCLHLYPQLARSMGSSNAFGLVCAMASRAEGEEANAEELQKASEMGGLEVKISDVCGEQVEIWLSVDGSITPSKMRSIQVAVNLCATRANQVCPSAVLVVHAVLLRAAGRPRHPDNHPAPLSRRCFPQCD